MFMKNGETTEGVQGILKYGTDFPSHHSVTVIKFH